MKTAIYGAGSLGIILGAYIAKNGEEIHLINRNPNQVNALNTDGARVVGTVEMTVPATAKLPQDMDEDYDVIFLMTKQQENRETAAFLKDRLSDKGVVVTLQNGLPEPLLAEVLGEERVLGCTVAWGATMIEAGVSQLTSEPDSLTFGLGRMDGKSDEMLLAVKDLLEKMGPVEIERNFMGARWSKLLINASFSGMSAVLGCTFGEAAKEKKSRICVQRIIKECIDVSRAAGIRIEPVQGKDIVKLLDYKGGLKRRISFFIIPIAIKKHAGLKASMLQDLEKGKTTEVDAINGAVSAEGKRVGVATPYNDRVVELIHRMEKGEISPGFGNVSYFNNL
ncbi:2-dehydropantoate 2-reductase [Eubacteriales bacterium OttesenSCG-928-M02]|nr:2-dehydropantoate 2-reductase [Eubacteriales bacterium OttesenSCG-928-M02]